jgi:replicative DNA helicase
MGGQVVVNRRPISKLDDVLSVYRYYAEIQQARYFIVDYVQLIRTQADHGINERVEEVMNRLREVTLEYQAVTVALAQFNRTTSFNRALRPVAQGLAGSSAIENDSHQVLLFDHSRWTKYDGGADTWLLLDKNRHGPTTEIPVRWDFTNLRLSTRTPTLEEQEAHHGALTKTGRLR